MKNILLLCIISFIVGAIISFFIGRKTIDVKTKTEYIKQEPVEGSADVKQLTPFKEEIPTNPVLPVKFDTVYLVAQIDTAAIIADYIVKRYYDITAFDNSQYGTLKLLPTLQYNKLSDLSWEFTPIQVKTTVYKEPALTPFISSSYSTIGYFGIGGGMFYNNYGLEYQYQKSILNNNNQSGHIFSFKYKF